MNTKVERCKEKFMRSCIRPNSVRRSRSDGVLQGNEQIAAAVVVERRRVSVGVSSADNESLCSWILSHNKSVGDGTIHGKVDNGTGAEKKMLEYASISVSLKCKYGTLKQAVPPELISHKKSINYPRNIAAFDIHQTVKNGRIYFAHANEPSHAALCSVCPERLARRDT
ncbi:hypothetical protein GBF38_010299 [Nibea albiflora]|uniref:Uncharacterized protein n=1 Tax=Nibea albiflora TaxID=240163 RepID=A0ACB7F2L7_NIBAL|nr:hypothetical protein GBF38_010299 [Nibea albiflora]